MELVRVKRHYQITLPAGLRKRLNIDIGDYVEVENKEGDIVMRPVKVVHPDQEYFYTKEWQEGESQADKDISKGDVIGPFDNVKDSLKALKRAKI